MTTARTASDADMLATLLMAMRRCGDRVIDASGLNGADIAKLATAVAMSERGPAFVFRAVFEGWDLERINRELF